MLGAAAVVGDLVPLSAAAAAAVAVVVWLSLELIKARRWHAFERYGDELVDRLDRAVVELGLIADALELDRTRPLHELELDEADEGPPA